MDISRVKMNLGQIVLFYGAKYRLVACSLRRSKDGSFRYEAELRDLNAQNSSVICPLNLIEEVK